MQFTDPPRRKPAESIVPMINVVFLLLIFFLMTAQIAPPEPFDVTPPEALSEEPAEGEFVLYLDAGGQLGFLDALGEEAALAAFQTALEAYCETGGCSDDLTPPSVQLRADAEVPAARVAALLPRLGAAGARDVMLVTAAR